MGIEPTWLAWKAKVLPLNYIRIYFNQPSLSDSRGRLNKVDIFNYTKKCKNVNTFLKTEDLFFLYFYLFHYHMHAIMIPFFIIELNSFFIIGKNINKDMTATHLLKICFHLIYQFLSQTFATHVF